MDFLKSLLYNSSLYADKLFIIVISDGPWKMGRRAMRVFVEQYGRKTKEGCKLSGKESVSAIDLGVSTKALKTLAAVAINH